MHRVPKRARYGTENLWKGAKIGVRVFADVQNFAQSAHGIPLAAEYPSASMVFATSVNRSGVSQTLGGCLRNLESIFKSTSGKQGRRGKLTCWDN